MSKKIGLRLAAVSVVAVLGTFNAANAHAERFARILAVTDCHAQQASQIRHVSNDGFSVPTLYRNANGLKVRYDEDSVAVRCTVPSNSNLSHTSIDSIRVFGWLSGSTKTRVIKACSLGAYDATYYCGQSISRNGGGAFVEDIPVPPTWNESSRIPMIVLVLHRNDSLQAIVVSDE